MKTERSQFTFYASFFKAIGRIKDDAARAQAYDAICAYALTGVEPDIDALPDIVALCFELIKPNLDTARRKSGTAKDKDTAEKETGCADDGGEITAGCEQDNDMMPTGCADDDANKKKKEKENKKEVENKKEKEKEIEIENECYNARANDAFDRFWAAYPRKVGKADAKRSFSKLRGVKTETLIAAIERQKQSLQWQKDNGQYIPNPATWLNQGRWEDVLRTADNKGTCQQQTTVDASQLDYLREVYAKVKGG